MRSSIQAKPSPKPETSTPVPPSAEAKAFTHTPPTNEELDGMTLKHKIRRIRHLVDPYTSEFALTEPVLFTKEGVTMELETYNNEIGAVEATRDWEEHCESDYSLTRYIVDPIRRQEDREQNLKYVKSTTSIVTGQPLLSVGFDYKPIPAYAIEAKALTAELGITHPLDLFKPVLPDELWCHGSHRLATEHPVKGARDLTFERQYIVDLVKKFKRIRKLQALERKHGITAMELEDENAIYTSDSLEELEKLLKEAPMVEDVRKEARKFAVENEFKLKAVSYTMLLPNFHEFHTFGSEM